MSTRLTVPPGLTVTAMSEWSAGSLHPACYAVSPMQAATRSGRWQRAAAGLLAVALLLGAASARAAPARIDGPAAPPTTLVLFGASGDLAKRKIFPSLKALWEGGKLPADFKIVAASRDRVSRAQFLARLREGVSSIAGIDVNDPAWKEIESRIEYRRVDLSSTASVRSLRGRLDAIDRASRGPPRQRLLYLAVTPSVLDRAIDNLGKSRLLRTAGRRSWWRSRSAATSRARASSTASWPGGSRPSRC